MGINKIVYIEHEGFYEGVLPNGMSFKFDKEDYEFVSSKMWHMKDMKTKYIWNSKLNQSMHRIFMKEQLRDGCFVDHINNERTDNRRSNLQMLTFNENIQKQVIRSNNKSGHIGVKWSKQAGKWQAQITREGKRKHLGYYDEMQDAVVARKKEEEKYKVDTASYFM